MGSFSIWHWLIVLAVVLILFGSNKVSGLMGEFGKGIKNFKQNIADDDKPKDASMASTSSLNAPGNAPVIEPVKTNSTVNQG